MSIDNKFIDPDGPDDLAGIEMIAFGLLPLVGLVFLTVALPPFITYYHHYQDGRNQSIENNRRIESYSNEKVKPDSKTYKP